MRFFTIKKYKPFGKLVCFNFARYMMYNSILIRNVSMTDTRKETDSFGPLEVPVDRYWGAQTQRSIINFPIGWEKQPIAIVRALGVIKKACAIQNKLQGGLDAQLADAIIKASSEVIDGKFDDWVEIGDWEEAVNWADDKYVSDEWEAYIQSTKDLTARLRAEAGLTP